MPHGSHIYAKASAMSKATMFACPHSYNALPHCNCVILCCSKFTGVDIPDQEIYYQYSDTTPSIIFHIYHLIARCSTHGRLPLNDKNICRKFKHNSDSEKSTKLYTRKEIVMMETTISNFHKSLYIPSIQKFVFHIPRVQILGTSHCGESSSNWF